MASQHVDLLLSASWIMPIAPADALYHDCCIVIHDGKVLGIEPLAQAQNSYTADQHLHLDDHLLMPGLINGHGHAAMSLLRCYADDLPLMTWLEKHIWPAEKQWVDDKFVLDGTELAIAEMLKSGTTCFSDMYFYPEVAAQVAHSTGIRAQITFPILEFPTPWAEGPDEALNKGLSLHDNYKAIDRITIGFGPHAPYTVGNETFTRVATLSAELQAPIQIHLHETQGEIDTSEKEHGKRPTERLDALGVITPRTQCVHMTALNDSDIALIAKHNASIIHCPESNLKLASGLCPVQALIDAGITVGLGTDGAASNNDLDLFGELKTAAMIGKIAANNAEAVSAKTALYMATLGGAKALGIDHLTGSLETGKAADIIALDLGGCEHMPNYNLSSLLTYTQQGHNVSYVWVDGKCLLKNKELTTINHENLKQRTQAWQAEISGAKS